MKVTTKSEEELGKRVVLDPGIYKFEVIEAIETFSKKGNEMIEMKVRVNDQLVLKDWLLDAMDFKIKHFCEATQLHRLYRSGELRDFDCRGKTGTCIIEVETGQDRDGNAYDRNKIKDYVPLEELEYTEASPPPYAVPVAFADDDIPF